MIIKIDMSSNISIHKQLEKEIKYGIVTKQLKPNESLPSIRTLASDLGINMHTVNKVYKTLETENIISKSRYGFYVNDLSDVVKSKEGLEEIKESLLESVICSELLNINQEELVSMLDNIYTLIKEEKNNNE